MAQKSAYTEWHGEMICEGLAEGRSMAEVCQALGIAYSTAKQWELDRPEYAANVARARELMCHSLAHEALQIADTPQIGIVRTVKPDGGVEEREEDMTAHRKLRIDTRKWLLARWLPKVYGDKLAVGGDPDAPPIQTNGTITLSAEDAYKRMLGGG